MIFFDTETIGLTGPIVLLQWSGEKDNDIHLHYPFNSTVNKTIEVFEMLCNEGVCAFNLVFDWFHVCQMGTILLELKEHGMGDKVLIDIVDTYYQLEEQATQGKCFKPKIALDLMLVARKTEYQSTMDRSDIRIKKIPIQLAFKLADELNKRIELKDIYFARYADPSRRWQVLDSENEDFRDVVLKFAPTSALKALAQDALGVKETILHSEVEYRGEKIEELGYRPYGSNWIKEIKNINHHWLTNKTAIKYATNDVVYLKGLNEFFNNPIPDDDDSVLAAMVGAVRWKGFAIDSGKMWELYNKNLKIISKANVEFNSTNKVKRYIGEVMDDVEKIILEDGTKAAILLEISKWKESKVCEDCSGLGCDLCNYNGLIENGTQHPAAVRAEEVLGYRRLTKENDILEKLIRAKRFHASFNVIGTLSSRMSGTDGLNAQGINRASYIRNCFPLADNNSMLSGGDFEGFEVVLMDAAYGDPKLREDLKRKHKCIKCNGKGCGECKGTGEVTYKIHGLFGESLFDMTYLDILKTKGLPGDKDKYTRSKNCVFAMAYGGDENTLVSRAGVNVEQANKAYQKWIERYKVWGDERRKIFNRFCSMKQSGGIGTKVEWDEPAEYIESLFGFKRYFILENMITKELFNLAESPPKDWLELKIKVKRRDRLQTAAGAVRSALYCAAFNLQAGNMRAAANHVIQSSGATITKNLQRKIWDLQPYGINDWVVQPLNVHDEIMVVHDENIVDKLEAVVKETVDSYKEKVPLIAIDWKRGLSNWGGK